jgi:diacylglycerol O-acyltransferase / wax synthase
MPTRRLNAIDQAYLDGENDNTPMHIACLVFLDAAPLLDSLGRLRVRFIRAHVRKSWAIFNAARLQPRRDTHSKRSYEWQFAGEFDLGEHVSVVPVGGQGTDRDVLNCCAKLLEPRMDRDRPMWRLHLLTGVSGDRVGMLFQLHHALADGVGGAAMLMALTDQIGHPTPTRTEPTSGQLDRLWNALTHLPELALSTLSEARNVTDGAAHLAQTLRPRSTTSLNAVVSPNRRMDVMTVRVSMVLEASRTLGVSVNDLMLASIAGAMGTILEHRGEDVRDLRLEALVPVSTRSSVSPGDYGNHTAVLQVPLPVGIADPIERLRLISAAMTTRKEHHVASTVAALEKVAQYVPLPFVGNLTKNLFDHQKFVNLAISNVRGPLFPLTILGSPIRSTAAFLPLASDLPVSFAIFSYDQNLTIGVLSDPTVFPESSEINDEIANQLHVMCTHTNDAKLPSD